MRSEQTSAYGQQSGLRLFFWNLWHYFMVLVALNFLFVLCCIPVVTIGPAITALCRVCCCMAAGQPLLYPYREFWTAFRGNLRQGIAAGLICGGWLLAASYSLELLNYLQNTSLLPRLIIWVAMAVFLMCALYVFPQIAMLKLTVKQIFGNAIRLMLVRLKESVAAVALGCLVLLGPLYFWPMSITFYFVLIFSAGALVCCAFAWPGIDQYLVDKENEG